VNGLLITGCAHGIGRAAALMAASRGVPLALLERENRELRRANEILRKASAYFAMAELDRRSKP